MDKYTKKSNTKGESRRPALGMVEIPRAGPGDIENTTKWGTAQGNTKGGRRL